MALSLAQADPDVAAAIDHETLRQHEGLEMIASENFVSEAVLEAAGSVFTNKYAEGYPGRRYYGGCEYADVVENLARDRAKQIFGAEHANVQPHSGSQANASAYMAVLQAGDTILGLDLAHGGHLTHGHRLSFSGKLYRTTFYTVRRDTEVIDYDELEAIAEREKPKVIIGGASAYPRLWDFARMRQIADKVGAIYIFDMAHIAGLVAGGVAPLARAPRAHHHHHHAQNSARPARRIDPLRQGFSDRPEARADAGQGHRQGRVSRPAGRPAGAHHRRQGGRLRRGAAPRVQDLCRADRRQRQGARRRACRRQAIRLVSGGTDNHLMLVDVFQKGILGSEAELALGKAGITVNKNAIPYDTNPPLKPSGIRIGTPALTTRGMKEPEMRMIAAWIAKALEKRNDDAALERIRGEVAELANQFPLYAWRRQGVTVGA